MGRRHPRRPRTVTPHPRQHRIRVYELPLPVRVTVRGFHETRGRPSQPRPPGIPLPKHRPIHQRLRDASPKGSVHDRKSRADEHVPQGTPHLPPHRRTNHRQIPAGLLRPQEQNDPSGQKPAAPASDKEQLHHNAIPTKLPAAPSLRTATPAVQLFQRTKEPKQHPSPNGPIARTSTTQPMAQDRPTKQGKRSA